MPTKVDSLTKDSSDDAYKEAIQDCIAKEIEAGHKPQQAEAMCYAMAEKKAGRAYPKTGKRFGE